MTKVESIIKQIDDLFSDTTVSQYITIDYLQEIRDELDIKIEALEADIKNKEIDS